MDVYNLETITALAFHLGTYGAEQIRQALLDRIMHGRKEKTAVFVSLFTERNPTAVGKRDEYQQASISPCKQVDMSDGLTY